jgi:hypothetical protein
MSFPIAGWTVDNTNKRVTYTAAQTRKVYVNVVFSFYSSQSDEIARFRLAKNGTTDSDTEIANITPSVGTGSSEYTTKIQGTFSLATNDYIELHATLDSSVSDTITVSRCNISIMTI